MAMLYSNYIIGEGSLIVTFDGCDIEDVNNEVVKSGSRSCRDKNSYFQSLNVLLWKKLFSYYRWIFNKLSIKIFR